MSAVLTCCADRLCRQLRIGCRFRGRGVARSRALHVFFRVSASLDLAVEQQSIHFDLASWSVNESLKWAGPFGPLLSTFKARDRKRRDGNRISGDIERSVVLSIFIGRFTVANTFPRAFILSSGHAFSANDGRNSQLGPTRAAVWKGMNPPPCKISTGPIFTPDVLSV